MRIRCAREYVEARGTVGDRCQNSGVAVRQAPKPRPRGVVLLITLLALMLIGSLVFYVFNTGQAVQQRVATQNAADAAVISGAAWVARSMNTAAMSNVGMARLIAYVCVLDATDEALQPAYAQSKALHDALAAEEAGDGGASGGEGRMLQGQMQAVVADYAHDLVVLQPLKQTFKAPQSPSQYASPGGHLDVRTQTFVHGPGGRGTLWASIYAMDGLGEAAMTHAGNLARQAAMRLGRADMQADGAVMCLPGRVAVPWHKGVWEDFKRPVSDGLLPQSVDDKQMNRGPWDTVFGFRDQAFKWELVQQGVWHSGGHSVASGPGGPGGLGPREHSSGHWDPRPQRRKVADGYQVFGPMNWMLRNLRYGKLKESPFYQWRDLFAQWKLGYAFDGNTEKTFRKPVWLTDWSGIEAAAKSGGIVSTKMFVVRVESDVQAGSAEYLSPGSYTLETAGKVETFSGDWSVNSDPCARDTNDPRAWEKKLELWRRKCPAFKKLGKAEQAQWQAAKYVRLDDRTWRFGSPMVRDGKQVWQYMYYTVLGVDVGKAVAVRNPFNFHGAEARPVPIELDQQALGAANQAGRMRYLNLLAIAQDGGKSAIWGSQFDKRRVYPHGVAIAQAEVFNNHSWDLWTQMWHARLVPVSGFGQWAQVAQAAPAESWAGSGLSSSETAGLCAYLQRVQGLAGVMLSH